ILALLPAHLAAHPLQLGRRRLERDPEQPLFVVRRRHPRHRPYLRVAQRPAPERVIDLLEPAELAGDADLLPRGPERDAQPPREPMRAALGALLRPALRHIADADQRELPMRRRVDVRGQRRELALPLGQRSFIEEDSVYVRTTTDTRPLRRSGGIGELIDSNRNDAVG